MRRTYLVAIVSSLAVAYVLKQWYTRRAHKPKTDATRTRTLPPLRTHALPPPLPQALSPCPTSSTEESTETQGETVADPLLDVLSPPPTHVITRRRSMRAHDLFAASHISFAELGNLVAPEEDI